MKHEVLSIKYCKNHIFKKVHFVNMIILTWNNMNNDMENVKNGVFKVRIILFRNSVSTQFQHQQ